MKQKSHKIEFKSIRFSPIYKSAKNGWF